RSRSSRSIAGDKSRSERPEALAHSEMPDDRPRRDRLACLAAPNFPAACLVRFAPNRGIRQVRLKLQAHAIAHSPATPQQSVIRRMCFAEAGTRKPRNDFAPA